MERTEENAPPPPCAKAPASSDGVVIEIADYDPDWPRRFSRAALAVREALGNRAIAIEHVGSTAVPGLAAKPVIDIILVVSDSSDEARYFAPLESARFRFVLREPDWHAHRLFKSDEPAANLHVFSEGCPEVERVLRFCDWLRANPQDLALYEATKRALACKAWAEIDDYANAKSAVVAEIMARACTVTEARNDVRRKTASPP